ncbi:hypothetical protein K492DRAFT_7734 [Lichtheimia hyalospora FSU 10163]|nr:hypothetical protein K492DRAFT_7734 [Lichtheimia hyalospora FSU 10163]
MLVHTDARKLMIFHLACVYSLNHLLLLLCRLLHLRYSRYLYDYTVPPFIILSLVPIPVA